ncbi:hypothetical protein M6B22_02935 [Jatrophihabitans cynanchi]|uniref:Meckel syndrome type 1 protein n=1 Tax=Jatrophihabitans cynanchi TaxID=2944128 RepID=A0ABY7K1I9_9ACTN|nr:hypothetical protein [Jatrophihabitans sp. SB3-54]WAX57733.1 hypothetical protein M6B22_02935 [Jatrophihabitans sp. SB3-54]
MSADTPPETGVPPGGFGAGVADRLRLPGPTHLRPRPSRIGSIASSSGRFAAALARPIPVRQRLQGPQLARVNSFRDAGTQPPRWWFPEPAAAAEQPRPARHFGRPERLSGDQLPRRGLPRAAHRMPDEQTRLSTTPGGIVESLVSTAAPVRRMDAVVAAGPMLTSHDRAKLNAVTAATRASQAREAIARETSAGAGRPGGGTPARAALRRTPARTEPTLPAAPAPARTPGQPAAPAARTATPPPPSTPAGTAPSSTAPSSTAPSTTPPSTTPSGTALPAGGPSAAQSARATWLPARAPRFDTARRAARSGGISVPPGHASATGAANEALLGAAASATESSAVSTGVGLRSATAPRLGGALAGGASLGVLGSPAGLGTSGLRRMVGGAHAVRPALSTAQARLGLFAPAGLPGRSERIDRSAGHAPAAKHAQRPAGRAATAPAPTPSPTSTTTPTTTPAAARTAQPPQATGTSAATAGRSAAEAVQRAATGRDVGTAGAAASRTSGAGAPADPQLAGRTGGAAAPALGSPGGPTSSTLRRSARRFEPRGVDLATARGLAGAVQPNRLLSPALAAAQLPSSSSYPGWLPGRIPGGGPEHRPERRGRLHRSPEPRRGEQAARSVPGSSSQEPLLRTADPRAMGDLLASGRGAVHGAAPEQLRALASAFGPGEQIRPAGAAAPRGAVPAGLASPGPARSDVPLSAGPGAFAASALAGPDRRAGTRPERGRQHTGRTAPPGGRERSGTGHGAAARASAAASASLPAPTYLPAPPPVSVSRSPAARAGSPPVPASARPGAPALARGPDGTLRRSLVDTTADLFRAEDAAAFPSDELQEGQQMAQNDPARLRVVRSGETGFTAEAAAPKEVSVLDDPRRLQELVDTVVERIEAKVIDELERRGRRHTPGAF